MSETSVPDPQSQPEAPPAGFFSNLFNLYIAPSEGFASILRKPTFLVPMVLMVVLGLIFVGIWTQHMDAREFGKAQLQDQGQWDRMTPEQREQSLNIQEKVIKPMVWVTTLVASPLFILIVASVLMLIFRTALGSQVGFKESMAITAWSSFAVGLIQTPLMVLTYFLKAEWNINPGELLQANLTLLLDKAEVSAAVWSLAGAIDLFSLWTIFLLAVGFGLASKRSTASALWPIVLPWVLFVLGRAGIAALMS